METEHTKGPWCFGSFDRLLVVPVEDAHPNKHYVIADLGETEFPYNANARRIVACVNACEDILDYELSLGCVARLSEQLRTVTKQRDDLLAATEAIVINAEECLDWDDSTAMLVPIGDYHRLMEAIANIKESK